MQSGRDSKRFDETSSSTIIFSSAIESGITCFEWMKLFNIKATLDKTINIFTCRMQLFHSNVIKEMYITSHT
jgi:hypothetical protein